jgi:hypothetical protein
VRHAFLLSEICKDTRSTVDFETIAQMDVDPGEVTGTELKPWALRTLSERRWRLGLDLAEFVTLDEHDEFGQCFANHWIAWDGVGELVVA